MKMKKMIILTLFSSSLLVGTGNVFADELDSVEAGTAESVLPDETEVPTEPSLPDESDVPVDPTEPTEPTEPETPTEPTDPEEPDVPDEPDVPVDPTEPIEPETPTEPTEPEKPMEPEKPVDPVEPTQPVVPEPPVTPSQPSQNEGQGTTQTQEPNQSAVEQQAEATSVPSADVPVTTQGGEKIVAVSEGVPMKQTEKGLEPIQSGYKLLTNGNVEVKDQEGKMKVLPHTGEKDSVAYSVMGGLLTTLMSIVFYKKRNV